MVTNCSKLRAPRNTLAMKFCHTGIVNNKEGVQDETHCIDVSPRSGHVGTSGGYRGFWLG